MVFLFSTGCVLYLVEILACDYKAHLKQTIVCFKLERREEGKQERGRDGGGKVEWELSSYT